VHRVAEALLGVNQQRAALPISREPLIAQKFEVRGVMAMGERRTCSR